MGDLQARITQALREKSRAEDVRAENVRADHDPAVAELGCPLGCEGLVFNNPDLKWEHLQSMHPGCLLESPDGVAAFEARGGLKARSRKRSCVIPL